MIIRYLTVAEWGGRWARPPVAEKLLDGECAVHHVGGTAWMGGTRLVGSAASSQAAVDASSRLAACKVFYDLNEYAINTKGYSFLDYDVLAWYDQVNDIGWIADGRGEWLSAATRDRNEIAEAVCLAGNYQLRKPLQQELELLAHAIVHGINKGWLSPNCIIYPHRDNPAHPEATQCCGQYLIPELVWVRAYVYDLLDPFVLPPPPTSEDVVLPEDIEAIATRVLELAASDAVIGKQFRWAVGAAPWQTNLGDGPLNENRPAGQILGSIRSDTALISAAVRKLQPGATADEFVQALAAELSD